MIAGLPNAEKAKVLSDYAPHAKVKMSDHFALLYYQLTHEMVCDPEKAKLLSNRVIH